MDNPEASQANVRVTVQLIEELPFSMMPGLLDESDVMLDPWVELPAPSSDIVVFAKPGALPAPDLPEIPANWEES